MSARDDGWRNVYIYCESGLIRRGNVVFPSKESAEYEARLAVGEHKDGHPIVLFATLPNEETEGTKAMGDGDGK